MRYDVTVHGLRPGWKVVLDGVPVRWVRAFDTDAGWLRRCCDVCVHGEKHVAECGTKVCEITERGTVEVYDQAGRLA